MPTISHIFEHPNFSEDYWSPSPEMIAAGLAGFNRRTPYMTGAGELASCGMAAFGHVDDPPLPDEDMQFNRQILDEILRLAECMGFKDSEKLRQHFADGTQCPTHPEMLAMIHTAVALIGEEEVFAAVDSAHSQSQSQE